MRFRSTPGLKSQAIACDERHERCWPTPILEATAPPRGGCRLSRKRSRGSVFSGSFDPGAGWTILDSVNYSINTGGTGRLRAEFEGGSHVAASPLAQDVDAVRCFNRFYTRQIGVLQEKLLHSSFSLTEGRVLYEIGYHGDSGMPRATAPTAVDLGKVLELDGGYLSRILQRFTRRRLITRRTSDADARQAHLAL